MGKKFKYKGSSRFNSIICVNAVAMMLLGISYGQWSNILTANAKVSTGMLSVEGAMDEILNASIRGEIVQLEQRAPGYYKGSIDIIFSVENTGNVAAFISFNKDVIDYSGENTWIKFINGDTVISEYSMPIEIKKFDVSIKGRESTMISERLWDVEEFLLSPGERAIVTLKEWEFEGILGENLEQVEMEVQVNLLYKDRTGAWYGDTSNSLYIRKPLSELYDITTLEMTVPPIILESDIAGTIPSEEEDVAIEEELGVDVPVTLPSDEDETITEGESEVDVPVTLPSDEDETITEEESEVDVPVTLPSDEDKTITEEELEVDIPVTLPEDKENLITGVEEVDTPTILPSDTVIGENIEGALPID